MKFHVFHGSVFYPGAARVGTANNANDANRLLEFVICDSGAASRKSRVASQPRREGWRASVLTSRLPLRGRMVADPLAERREGRASARPGGVPRRRF